MPWRTGLEERLARTLAPLVARGVPLRSVSAGPLEGVARVRWADGTVVIARSVQPGGLVRLTRLLLQRGGGVVAVQVDPVDDAAAGQAVDPLQPAGVVVTLQPLRRGQPLRLLVLGLDQPD